MSYIIFKCKNKKERLCVIMLKPAILFKDQIDRKFLEMYYTKEMRYYTAYFGCNCTPEISPEPMEHRYDWAIVDDDDPEKLLGYIGYRHNPVVDSIENFGLFSFDPGNYKVGKEVFNQTTTVLVKNVNDQQVALLKIEEERKEYQKKSNEIDIRIAILQNKVDNVNQEIDQLEKEYANKGRIDEFSEKQERIEKRRQEILKEISSLQEAQRLNNKLAQRIGNEVAQRQTELDQLQKVISIYQKYNKNSYVRLSDITTISKLRIERINKFDPSGKIRLTSEQMKGISDQLMKLYISN